MEWIKQIEQNLPIKSWCGKIEEGALKQAEDLSAHPTVVKHIALMPDCHQGYGMPIGGVIASRQTVIPNAVGVDIGCGMGAVKTNLNVQDLGDKRKIREILNHIKERIPVGEGHAHKTPREWEGFSSYLETLGAGTPAWRNKNVWDLAYRNLGTLGGGNHFIELQKSEIDEVWLMLHSGSRNLGYNIASYYHKLALSLNQKWQSGLPNSELAFLPEETLEGQAYIRDMTFAMEYARENRRRMMEVFKDTLSHFCDRVEFEEEINIHHNYASLENHFGENVWVHRKGATSAKDGEMGIIPGSMGTSSYIVRGRGNPESFMSCSHGAGRKMSRTAACEQLDMKECDQAMEGIVFDRWSKLKRGYSKRKSHARWDLSEAPLAYKNIDEVIQAELDLIDPVVRLSPLGVIKG